jgi:hypothetical protein
MLLCLQEAVVSGSKLGAYGDASSAMPGKHGNGCVLCKFVCVVHCICV